MIKDWNIEPIQNLLMNCQKNVVLGRGLYVKMAGAVRVLPRAKMDSTDAFCSLFCYCLLTKRREYLYYDYQLAAESEDVDWN